MFLDKYELGQGNHRYKIDDFMGAEIDISYELDNYGSSRDWHFVIMFKNNNTEYRCSLKELPDNDKILFSYHSYRLYGDGGYGTLANKIRCEIMRLQGYKGIICTVNSTNVKQLKIMENNGWNKTGEYTSTEDYIHRKHKVFLFYKELVDEEYQKLFI